MVEKRAPTTAKVAGMIQTHKDDPNAHHVPGGGADIKSGVVVNAPQGEDVPVTFTTPFASVPQVVLTMQDAAITATNARIVVHSVSTTGFTFELYRAGTVAWIATDAGDP